jgi:hypothetical protein
LFQKNRRSWRSGGRRRRHPGSAARAAASATAASREKRDGSDECDCTTRVTPHSSFIIEYRFRLCKLPKRGCHNNRTRAC